MIEKKIYGKTQRISGGEHNVVITEKIDGSNLCIYKMDSTIFVAQRNYIFSLDEIVDGDEFKHLLYKGLEWRVRNMISWAQSISCLLKQT